MLAAFQPAVLAHGSGLDELAIFLFPVFIGFGFWLMTRQRGPAADDDDAEEPKTVAPPVEEPVAPPRNGYVSPFHGLIAPPRRAGDGSSEGDRSTVSS